MIKALISALRAIGSLWRKPYVHPDDRADEMYASDVKECDDEHR